MHVIAILHLRLIDLLRLWLFRRLQFALKNWRKKFVLNVLKVIYCWLTRNPRAVTPANLKFKKIYKKMLNTNKTHIIIRMHSSRMRTVRSSGRFSGGGGCVCSWGVCLFWGCLLGGSAPRGVSALGGVCSGGLSALEGVCSGGVCLESVCSGCVCSRGSAPGGVVSQHALRQTPPLSTGTCL